MVTKQDRCWRWQKNALLRTGGFYQVKAALIRNDENPTLPLSTRRLHIVRLTHFNHFLSGAESFQTQHMIVMSQAVIIFIQARDQTR
jgi:hypothetical protein